MNPACEAMPRIAEENDDVGARAREPPSPGTGGTPPVPCSLPCLPLRTPHNVPSLVVDLNSGFSRKRVPRVISAHLNVVCGRASPGVYPSFGCEPMPPGGLRDEDGEGAPAARDPGLFTPGMGPPQPLSPPPGMLLNSVCEAVLGEEEENDDAGARTWEPPPFGESVPGTRGASGASAPGNVVSSVVSMSIPFVCGVPGVPPTWLSPGRETTPGA